MTTYIIAYIAALIFFLAVDMLWLAGIAKKIYGRQLGKLMTRNIRWGAAFVFYTLYLLGVVIFAIRPGIEAESPMTALTYGALYGFFCYMTYDLTNLATLKDWPEKLIWIDIPWGTVLTASAAVVGTWASLSFVS
ncbi:DUF2177 family protein [Hellea balneolensis]|uniref:DUF2177 family protein n=1 Tax=Hellea balneolensis TaxID=287478 RepID=UPI00040D11CB|nr:DUF2177 family protein [Hellea balneolensis]